MTDLERINELKKWVSELGIQCDVLEKSKALPLDVLLAHLGNTEDEERLMQFAYLPVSSDDTKFTKLLQLYLVFSEKASEESIGELTVILNEINNMTMLGYFGVGPNQEVFFRYVHAMPAVLDSEVSFKEMVNLAIISIKMFEQIINSVSAGRLGIEEALDRLAAMKSTF